MKETLSIRIDPGNPDHHLWLNRGVWWIHYTVHSEDGRRRRVRYSLGTDDRTTARVLRDAVFATWDESSDPAPAPPPAVELAPGLDGFERPGPAPDTSRAPLLAAIDRGMNLIGTLLDGFYVAVDESHGPSALVLWALFDPSQEGDGLGRLRAVARVPLEPEAWYEDRGRVQRELGAVLLHAWVMDVERSWELYSERAEPLEGELLEQDAVAHVVEAALRGRPLDLRRVLDA